MKRLLQLISCVALMTLANTSFAQTTDTKVDRPTEMTTKLTKALKLTPEQTGSIKSLAVNYFAELDVLAADKENYEAKKLSLDSKYDEKVIAVLNAEQLTQYNEIKAKQKAKAERKK